MFNLIVVSLAESEKRSTPFIIPMTFRLIVVTSYLMTNLKGKLLEEFEAVSCIKSWPR